MSVDEAKGMGIGAVARVTGVAADTIRTWERRYDVVEPLRDATGRRVYTDAQVVRLRTIGELAQRGERVADLARLSDSELEDRARLHVGASRDAAEVRVVVVHPTLGDALDGLVAETGAYVRVVGAADDPDDPGLDGRSADVVVVDLECLGAAPAEALDRLQRRVSAPAALLTGGLVARPLRRRLDRPGLRIVQGPASAVELRRLVADQARVLGATPAPPEARGPRFTRAQLERLLDCRPELQCECPNHLASLVLGLRAFEQYSRTCVSVSPEDAAFHEEMADGTARAVAVVEGLLARAIAHEGLEV